MGTSGSSAPDRGPGRGHHPAGPLKPEINGFGADPFAPGPAAGARAGFMATGEINRMDFGVSYNGPIPGGVLLGEKVQIILEIEAFRQTAG
jgi:hypothetical protein